MGHVVWHVMQHLMWHVVANEKKCDECNVINAMWKIQCNKYNVIDVMQEKEYDKCNTNNAMT